MYKQWNEYTRKGNIFAHTLTLREVAGFSLHAGVAAKGYQRQKLERLCR